MQNYCGRMRLAPSYLCRNGISTWKNVKKEKKMWLINVLSVCTAVVMYVDEDIIRGIGWKV